MMPFFNWFRRRFLERDLDRELQYHFDRRVADLTAAGRKQLAVERDSWARLSGAVNLIFEEGSR